MCGRNDRNSGDSPVLAFFPVVAISQISPQRPDKGSNFRVPGKKKAAYLTLLYQVVRTFHQLHPGMEPIFFSARVRKGSSTTFCRASQAFSYSTEFW